MAQRQLNINIALTPVLERDIKSDQFYTYYKEFPQAIAVGETEEDAETRLAHLVENMWKEHNEDLKETLHKYINDNHKNMGLNAKVV